MILAYAVIAIGVVASLALLYFGFTKDAAAGEPFQFKHLFERHSLKSSSRKLLLIEGFFLLTLSMVMFAYELLR